MNEPPNPVPPNVPPSAPAPPSPAQPPVPTAVSPPGAAMSAPPAKKSALPWVIGGCGCLTLLAIIVAVVCYFFYSKAKTVVEKATTMVEQAAKPTPSLKERTVSFPEKDPALSFTLPAGWITETGKDGGLIFTASDGFKFAIAAAPAVKNAQDAEALVPTILKSMADSIKAQDFKPKKVETSAKDAKKWSSVGEGRCKVDGREAEILAIVFLPKPDRYFSICFAATKEVGEAHGKEMLNILHSIGMDF